MRLPSLHADHALSRRAALLAPLLATLAPSSPAGAISATTMSGKTRPELGVLLVEPVRSSGPTIAGDVVLSGGTIATATFDSPWSLAEGGYYDVEAKTDKGDSAYVQVGALPRGKSLGSVEKAWFAATLFGVEGRYGAYGAPSDVKVLGDTSDGGGRTLDVAFTALSPGMAEVARRGAVRATQAEGSSDVLLLVASCSAARWKKGGEEPARAAAASFRVSATRKTELKQVPSADYRYGKSSGPSSMSSRNDGPQWVD